MPINYGTVVEGLPSSITANFVTEQIDLIAAGAGEEDTFSFTRDNVQTAAIPGPGEWSVSTVFLGNLPEASRDPADWVGGGFLIDNGNTFTNIDSIADITTITIAGSNGDVVLTVSGGVSNGSDFDWQIDGATGNALSAAEFPALGAAGTTLDITFSTGTGEEAQPTLDNEREFLYLEDTSGGIQGMLNINLTAGQTSHVSILGSFPDNPADAIIEYSPKDVFGQTGTDRSIFYQGSQTNLTDSSLTVRNRTLRLSGGIDINRIGSLDFEGTVVLHNTNTSGNVPYIRTRRNLSGGIENLVLDGDTAPFGIYWDQSFVGNLSPTTLALSRGLVVGNAGSSNGPFYTLVANLDATTNASTFIADASFGITGGDSVKFDVAVATHTSRQDEQARIHDIRNSVDGLAISCAPRLIGVSEEAGRGSANITSEFTYLVTDEDGTAIPNATVYIPSATTSAIGPINFDATISSNVSNNDVPNVVKFVADATITATTDANGYATSNTWASNTQTGSSNPVLLGHIGYYQFPTGITPQQRISNPGNFDRLGNTPTSTIAAYGYHPLQVAIDLRGVNVKEYTNALALDEGLTSTTEAAANAIMTYAIASRTATSITASTLDNLHDALYVSRLVTSRAGNIARTWSISGQSIDTAGSLTISGQPLSVGGTFNSLTQGTTSGTLTVPASSTIDFGVNYTTIAWQSIIPEILISDGRAAGAMSLATNGSYKITGGEITNLTVPTATTGVTIEIPDDVAGRDAFVTANPHVTVTTPPVISTIAFPGVVGNYIIRNNGATLASGTTNNDGATLVDISSTQYTSVDNVTLYWTGESYTDVVQPFTGMDFTIIPNRDVNVAEGDFAGTITAVFANDVATYTGTTSATAFSGTATNLWWNRAKSFLAYTQATVEYREFADSNTDPLISLTADNRTSVNGDFIKFVTGAPTQQVMTNVTNSGTANITEEVDLNAFQIAFRTADAYTSAQAQSDYATAGLSTDNSTRAIIDEELDAGKLTRVGRPS